MMAIWNLVRTIVSILEERCSCDSRDGSILWGRQVIKAQIWDTAGQERYRAITSACLQRGKGVTIFRVQSPQLQILERRCSVPNARNTSRRHMLFGVDALECS